MELYPFTLESDESRRDALRSYLLVTWSYERIRILRIAIVYALVALSLLIWVSEGWPDYLPNVVYRWAWPSWLVAFLGMLSVGALERTWHLKRLRCLDRLGRPPPNAGVTR
jgi:hypothetical protein